MVYQLWAYNLDPTTYKQFHLLADENANSAAAHRIARIALGPLGRMRVLSWPGGIPVHALRMDALSGSQSCAISVLYKKIKDSELRRAQQRGPANPASGQKGVRETIITGTNDGQILPAVTGARWLVERIDAYSQSGSGVIPWELHNGEADTAPSVLRMNLVAPAAGTSGPAAGPSGTFHMPFRRPIIVDALYAERGTATSQQVTFAVAATLLKEGL
jgi:hypothetical protein